MCEETAAHELFLGDSRVLDDRRVESVCRQCALLSSHFIHFAIRIDARHVRTPPTTCLCALLVLRVSQYSHSRLCVLLTRMQSQIYVLRVLQSTSVNVLCCTKVGAAMGSTAVICASGSPAVLLSPLRQHFALETTHSQENQLTNMHTIHILGRQTTAGTFLCTNGNAIIFLKK